MFFLRSAFLLLFAASSLHAEDIADQLKSLGPWGGDVRSLAVHPAAPETFFLGTSDGQIYRSTDAARSWMRVSPGLKRRNVVVDNLLFDPDDPRRLYAAVWSTKSNMGWLFVTDDSGRTFSEIGLGDFHGSIRAMAIAPSDPSVLALGIPEGVILSIDGGKSWERITRGYKSLHNVDSLAFDPSDSKTLYVGTWRRGWKTHDRGKTWIPVHQGMAYDSDMFTILVSPDNHSTLYSGACTGIYRSNNAGDSWTKLTSGIPKGANRTRTMSLDPGDPRIVYAGTTVGLFRSLDGGGRFQEILGDTVVNAIQAHPLNPRILVVGTDDRGVLRSDDGGQTFQPSNQGFVHRQVSDLALTVRGLYASFSHDGQDGGFMHRSAEGVDWQRYNQGLDRSVADLLAIHPARLSSKVYLRTASKLFVGQPGKTPWTPLSVRRDLKIRDIALTPDETALVLAAEQGLYRLDLKTGRTAPVKIAVYQGPAHTLVADPLGQSVFVGTDMGVFRSQDGKKWVIKVNGLPYVPVTNLVRSGRDLWAVTSQGLFLGTDLGESWKKVENPPTPRIRFFAADPAGPGAIYIVDGISGRLYRSDDRGASWTPIDLGPAPPRLSSLLVSGGSIFLGTLSDGLLLYGKDAAGSLEKTSSQEK